MRRRAPHKLSTNIHHYSVISSCCSQTEMPHHYEEKDEFNPFRVIYSKEVQIVHALKQSSNFPSNRQQNGLFPPALSLEERAAEITTKIILEFANMATGSYIKDFVLSKSQAALSTTYRAINADGQVTRCVLTGNIQLLCASCYFCQDQSFTFCESAAVTLAAAWRGLCFLAHGLEDLHVETSGSWLLACLITTGTPRLWLTVSKYLPLIRFTVQKAWRPESRSHSFKTVGANALPGLQLKHPTAEWHCHWCSACAFSSSKAI